MKINLFKEIMMLPKYLRSITKLQIVVIIFPILALSTGCSNTLFPNVYIPLNSLENYEATSADSVQIYVAQLPSRGFKEIGIFYFPSKGRINRPEQMAKNITVAKEFAAQHGANAVIRLDVTDFNVKSVAVRWK